MLWLRKFFSKWKYKNCKIYNVHNCGNVSSQSVKRVHIKLKRWKVWVSTFNSSGNKSMNLFTLAVSSIFFSCKFFTFCVNKHCSLGCQGGVLFHPRASEARSCDAAAGTSVGMCKARGVCVCVCVRRMLSVHISTPLWTHGTGGRWPCGYPAAVRGLRGSGRPTSPSESLAAGWLGNILQCFLVSCFFFGGVQRWKECCVLTVAHCVTWKTFIYILL